MARSDDDLTKEIKEKEAAIEKAEKRFKDRVDLLQNKMAQFDQELDKCSGNNPHSSCKGMIQYGILDLLLTCRPRAPCFLCCVCGECVISAIQTM